MSSNVYGSGASQMLGGDIHKVSQENEKLKQRLSQVEEQLFYMQADALTTEVEAVHAAAAKTKGLESQLHFKDQEIQRLKHELLSLSKKEAAQRSALKAEAGRGATNGHNGRTTAAADGSSERTAAVDPPRPPPAVDGGGPERPGGVSSVVGKGSSALPPRARVVEGPSVAIDIACDYPLDIPQMLQPSPCNRVDYAAMVSGIYPIYQRIRANLAGICGGTGGSTACHGGGEVSTMPGGTPAAKASRGTPGGTAGLMPVPHSAATSSAAPNNGWAIYDTPGSHVHRGADTQPLSSVGQPARVFTRQNELPAPAGVQLLLASLDEFIVSASTAALTPFGIVLCVRALASAIGDFLVPLWQSSVGKHSRAPRGGDSSLRPLQNTVALIENTLLNSLTLTRLCVDYYRAVVWTDYDVAFCKYCAAFQLYSTEMNSRFDAGASSLRVTTPLNHRQNGGTDISSGSSLLCKRPFGGSASPLAKKLFRRDSQSQSSPEATRHTNGLDDKCPAGDYSMSSEHMPVVSLVLDVAEGSEAEAKRLVNSISQRRLLVDPTLLDIGPQAAVRQKDQNDSAWHCRSMLRLTRRLRAITQLMGNMSRNSTGNTFADDDHFGAESSLEDLSIDAVNLGRQVLSFVQRHRRGLCLRPHLWALHPGHQSKTWGVEIDNEACLLFEVVFRGMLLVALLHSADSSLQQPPSGSAHPKLSTEAAARGLLLPSPSPEAINRGHTGKAGANNTATPGHGPRNSHCGGKGVSGNVLTLLASSGLDAEMKYRLLVTLSDVVMFSERAFEGLLEVHCNIQGSDGDCRPLSAAYTTPSATAPSLTASPSEVALSGAASRVEAPTSIAPAFPPPVNGSSIQTERRSISLITVLLSHLKVIDSEHRNVSVGETEQGLKSSCLQLQAVMFLVKLLERYKGEAVPVVLGIPSGSSSGCHRVDTTGRFMRPPIGTRPIPSESTQNTSAPSTHHGTNAMESHSRRRGTRMQVPMSPLQFEGTASASKRRVELSEKSARIVGGEKAEISNLPRKDAIEEMLQNRTVFDVERYLGSMSPDVLYQLMKAWLDGIRALDRAPDILDPNSRYYYISQLCLHLPSLFVLLAKHTRPSMKELFMQFGIHSEMQSAIYRVWAHRVHPSLKSSRIQVGFLGSLFS